MDCAVFMEFGDDKIFKVGRTGIFLRSVKYMSQPCIFEAQWINE